MTQPDPSNPHFEISVKFVNQTSRHLFLTGKAGTGKTTFLRYIREHSPKKLAVVAPTGIAAINAGGVTIHSFFQLPMGNFIPEEGNTFEGNFYNGQGLLKHLRLTSEKRKLIQELDLLIIDEVSMLRADLLDAMDVVLRHVRRQHHLPFGGVQMLYIGDLFQLPPVVRDEEWNVLKNYYRSPFFFHARALDEAPPLYLELKKIYRQKDETFIRILNHLRDSCLSQEDIDLLNSHYRPRFKPEQKGEYIILTTHNYKADQINKNELDNLQASLHTFKAVVDGDFNEKAAPADMELLLKEGAQIMFIRNDKGEQPRYYNGKIGTIKRIKGEEIYITFPGESGELMVEKETWKNNRYLYNPETDTVDEEILGTFTQFPLRLAWAITIHKSQGLTFTKAIVDAGNSFAPGQVYVALSRLTSLEGLVLYSRINADAILKDDQATAFSSTECETNAMLDQLKEGQKQYIHHLLLQVFDWSRLAASFESQLKEMDNRRMPALEEAKALLTSLFEKVTEQHNTAGKFTRQLEQMLAQTSTAGYAPVHARVEAAGSYFSNALHKDLFLPMKQHFDRVKKLPKVKKYLQDLQALSNEMIHKKKYLEQVLRISSLLMEGKDPNELLQQISSEKKAKAQPSDTMTKKTASKKLPKGATNRISLDLFKAGKSIQEIASERGLTQGTVEGHLISFIVSGDLQVEALVNNEKLAAIRKVMEESGDVSSSVIKEKLGDDYSYGEIRAVIMHDKKLREEKIA